MRLLSLNVRNYRIHRDLAVEFDPSRNLIGGSNETGKSTLAEAIHRVLFMRYRAGGDLRASMVSDIHGGHPEVKLTFEAAGDTWTIEKLFAGATRGTVRLSSRNGISLQGDAAEDKLAQITANRDGVANRENDLATRWSHLWVWQGTAGTDASSHAFRYRDELIQRLQENGLAAVMQSEADERAREKIRLVHEDIFTRTGAVKANSRLDQAAKKLDEVRAKLDAANKQKVHLESAIDEQESATREIADTEAALPGLLEQLSTARTSLTKASELRAQIENQKLVYSRVVADLHGITGADRQIRTFHAQATSSREALVPAEQELGALAEQATSTATKAAEAKAAADAVGNDLRLARQHYDLANACVTRFEKASAHETLATKAKYIAGIEKSLADDRDALSHLPAIAQSQLDTLRNLEAQQAQAQSALAAIATGIELIASPQAVLLDNQALVPGRPHVITEISELSLADGTRLLIQPGGGNSLATSRQKVSDLKEQLATLLDQLSLADSKQAVEIHTQRQTLDQIIAATQARLKDLGARDLPDILASAAAALAAATAEAERRHSALRSDHASALPETLAAALIWQNETREAFQYADQNDQSLRIAAEAAHNNHQRLLKGHQIAQQSLEDKRREISDHETSARTLEQIHGDSTTRAQAIAEAIAKECGARTTLHAITSDLSGLNPERLEQEVTRLERVILNLQHKQQGARTRLAVAQNTLATDGTTDPDADLLQAKARHAAATDECARERRYADAIDLLNRHFSESQEYISQSVTLPIADRVVSYLECLFGRGVRVDVRWSDPARATVLLTRPGEPTFAFDSLSGGAKEQVASAVRLASAEILAANHDGCLPILFDDAFAYADDDRIESLQTMLDLAANRGLQVLVLTCNPADYIGLGARETRLIPHLSNFNP